MTRFDDRVCLSGQIVGFFKRTKAARCAARGLKAGAFIDIGPGIALIIDHAGAGTTCSRTRSAIILASERDAKTFFFSDSRDTFRCSGLSSRSVRFGGCIPAARTGRETGCGGDRDLTFDLCHIHGLSSLKIYPSDADCLCV